MTQSLVEGRPPKGCTCGWPHFENYSEIRHHTWDCQIRTGLNAGQLSKFVLRELEAARSKFPAFNSPHEGVAVIREELEELWDHAKANTGRSDEAMVEAIQIAAMAMRYALDMSNGEAILRD